MSEPQGQIILVGAFPPPLHGMSAINAAMRDLIQQAGVQPQIINLTASDLDRSAVARVGRLPKILRGLMELARARRSRGRALYMSVSGGWGQISEILFAGMARLRGRRLFLHHHSFAYLESRTHLMALLVGIGGPDAVHVALSPGMAARFESLYRAKHVIRISNAAFLIGDGCRSVVPRQLLRTLGFIGNIAAEKGVFEFLDLLEAVGNLGLPLRAELAGPFQDAQTELMVRTRIDALPNVDYVGPKYGADKEAFFGRIDALIFPTRYVNEAEPLTIHEAMSCGIPIIAYGRGAIREIVGQDCGEVIDAGVPFVSAALEKIKAWIDDPVGFSASSRAAFSRFSESRAKSLQSRQRLLNDLLGDCVTHVAAATGQGR
ncbi:MAG: glycosyltransferase family 4 protein [Rhizomicrobium sp.]